MNVLARALRHLEPLVDEHDRPLGANWKPEVCPRYAAHSNDIVRIAALEFPALKRILTTQQRQLALAGLDCYGNLDRWS